MSNQPSVKQSSAHGVNESKQTDEEPNLKGTFASVMILGAFIIVSWISVFILYMYR
ncbi:Cytochrome c oxidase subunit IIa family protein [Salinibacillus kushneri]|uniref:Cytochrome c oxidase subunit IIa family protein n=1 Tax=Salinibacillus kushneri TaxID=237682 RepID=A0A1I0DH04_9BACI|nr:cytochrome c oxidase subunit 2A [Salinibacillus kushneri]SET31716.1 Cytochrome c oxidase subunit IIa family protein [Salinibacillus kushneri]